MTYDDMPAGLEMNWLVHKRVMGRPLSPGPAWARNAPLEIERGKLYYVSDLPALAEQVPEYSTDIAHAWQVVERMARIGREITMGQFIDSHWTARFDTPERQDGFDCRADTAPLAICRAALRAVT